MLAVCSQDSLQVLAVRSIKYGKLCVSVMNNILSNEEDSEECEHSRREVVYTYTQNDEVIQISEISAYSEKRSVIYYLCERWYIIPFMTSV